MLRRDALLLFCSAIPAVWLPPAQPQLAEVADCDFDDDYTEEDAAEYKRLMEVAQTLANIELASIKQANPETWQSLSYVNDVKVDDEYSAIYCVIGDTELLDRWAEIVDAAMYPGKLRVIALAKAGQIPGMDDGYNHVTLMLVRRESLELERQAFAELTANYPAPIC